MKAKLPSQLYEQTAIGLHEQTAIGKIMVANGYMTPRQVKWAADYQKTREPRTQIGQIFARMSTTYPDSNKIAGSPGTLKAVRESDIQSSLEAQKLMRAEAQRDTLRACTANAFALVEPRSFASQLQ